MRAAAAEADRALTECRLEARALEADVERLGREKGDALDRLEATKARAREGGLAGGMGWPP